MESILTSIKKMLGIMEEYEHFDQDIIIHINSVFLILTQLGVGPPEGFAIKSKNEAWTDFVPENQKIESIKSYMYLKTKLLFDPPLSSAAMEAIYRSINEFEWRLNVQAERSNSDETCPITNTGCFLGLTGEG